MSTDLATCPRPAQRRRGRCPTTDEPADRQGVHHRPGGPLVPGLRRLRRAQGGAGLPARPRAAPREHRVRLRHRLLVAVPLLPRHLRHALDPRPRAGDRDRHRDRTRGPLGVGRHRRRRRAVDRRQPPDPRAAPQRQHDDPAVQQPDLRPDQGSVLPHLRARQGHQVHADGLGRPPVQPGLAGARRRGHLRGPHHRLRPQAPHRGAVARPPPTAARRSWRSTRTARSSTTAPSTRSRTATPRPTRSSRWSTASRSGSASAAAKGLVRDAGHRRREGRRGRRPPAGAEADLLVHDAHAADPTTAFAISRLTDAGYLHQSPIGIFRQVERPTYDDQARDQVAHRRGGADDDRRDGSPR